MKRSLLLTLIASGGMAAIIACDNGSAGTTSGLSTDDCPIGTFRPPGITDCVFPAVDVNGQALGVSDNRCAFGQPAVPPECFSDSGGRPYLSTSTSCAPGYRFLEGSCDRTNVGPTTGSAGVTGTGFGGVDFTGGGGTGSAGSAFGGTGSAGDATGSAGDGVTLDAASD